MQLLCNNKMASAILKLQLLIAFFILSTSSASPVQLHEHLGHAAAGHGNGGSSGAHTPVTGGGGDERGAAGGGGAAIARPKNNHHGAGSHLCQSCWRSAATAAIPLAYLLRNM